MGGVMVQQDMVMCHLLFAYI